MSLCVGEDLEEAGGKIHGAALQDSFAGGKLEVVDVAPHRHAKAAGKGLEDAFYLVMFVLSLGLDVEVDGSAVREALEEM